AWSRVGGGTLPAPQGGSLMKTRKVLRFCFAVGLFAGAQIPPAFAQLEEIVVTAQRREESLQETSVAVTAVSGDRLQAAQINNIEDLQVIVPNVYFGNDFNMAKLTVRGVGANTSTTGSEAG